MGHVRAAADRYGMIEEGDRIAVGVSGGKDSLYLLYALAMMRRYYPKRYTVVALTADPCFGGAETDYGAVEALCREWDVEYRIRRTNLGKIIFEDRKEENPCSLCARMRRGILHDMAKDAGCGKIALGHHFDDAVQTFLMNRLLFAEELPVAQGPVPDPAARLLRGGGHPPRREKARAARRQKRLPGRRRDRPAGHGRADRRAGEKLSRLKAESYGRHAARPSGRLGINFPQKH